jgi:hypothetical protein
MNDRDDIRPKGTVEVECTICSWFFWIDCLDPRLPAGPFTCPCCEGAAVPDKADAVSG